MRAISLLGVWLLLLIVPFHLELYGQNKPIKRLQGSLLQYQNLLIHSMTLLPTMVNLPVESVIDNPKAGPEGNDGIPRHHIRINGEFPDIIGLAEIENLWILEYLLKKSPFKEANYGIVHKESPIQRYRRGPALQEERP